MDECMKTTLQVVFEHFRFKGFYCSPAPSWAFTKHLSTLPDTHICKHSGTGLLVESGFSFTHVPYSIGYNIQIVPFVDGKIVLEGVKRVNVGGKLLTNLLKETISFRQVNVQDSTYLVNQIKEKYSYLSLDVFRGFFFNFISCRFGIL